MAGMGRAAGDPGDDTGRLVLLLLEGADQFRREAAMHYEQTLDLAWQHVISGHRIVARQRQRVAEGEARGLDMATARATLRLFEQTQEIFEEHLQGMLEELSRPLGDRVDGDGTGDVASC